jgi:regulatory protein
MSKLIQNSDVTAAFNLAVACLARRDHTRQELYAKLRGKGFVKTAAIRALDRCEELNYLDDAKTAGILFNQLCRRGYGPRRIRLAMVQKGLDSDLIEELVGRDCSRDWELETAGRMLAKRAPSLSREQDQRRRREKAYRYLANRGFSREVVTQVIRRIPKE